MTGPHDTDVPDTQSVSHDDTEDWDWGSPAVSDKLRELWAQQRQKRIAGFNTSLGKPHFSRRILDEEGGPVTIKGYWYNPLTKILHTASRYEHIDYFDPDSHGMADSHELAAIARFGPLRKIFNLLHLDWVDGKLMFNPEKPWDADTLELISQIVYHVLPRLETLTPVEEHEHDEADSPA
jgi:hypothetical protein